MGRPDTPKRVRHIAPELPDELMLYILLKLDFVSKINAGQVCKNWDQLLKASSAEARHWGVVHYKVDSVVSRKESTARKGLPLSLRFENGIGRWIFKRAGAIESVKVSATLSSGQQGAATMKVLESSLPILAGCLSKHDNTMDLNFSDGSPFTSPLLSSSDFLTFLSPMVKSLSMCEIKAPITASQFASMCELSMLRSLNISSASDDEAQWGLQEMTSEISKLVNLESLVLDFNHSLESIPESIRCLQKLTEIGITDSSIRKVPIGLGRLANLSILLFESCGPLRFPHNLQGLKSLTRVTLKECGLEAIPMALCGVPCLLSMKLDRNRFVSGDGWPWWPTDLSRLTRLQRLDLQGCGILSLPPQISGLRGLHVLHVSFNKLSSLPAELSCLQSLREIHLACNCFATVPVSVLSTLTSINTISLWDQQLSGGQRFKVSSSLLPILHPGLVKLELRHYRWDALSLCHLGRAMCEVANRIPPVEILWGVC